VKMKQPNTRRRNWAFAMGDDINAAPVPPSQWTRLTARRR